MKNVIFFISIYFHISLFAQWNQTFDKLYMYKVKIEGLQNDEQALFLSKLISETDKVLIARFYCDYTGFIFSEQEINNDFFNDILIKSKITNLRLLDFNKEIPQSDIYLKIYNDFRPIRFDLSTTLPSPVIYKDKQKEARAYSIFKEKWVEKYPETYQSMQKSVEPYNEKELEEIKFKKD